MSAADAPSLNPAALCQTLGRCCASATRRASLYRFRGAPAPLQRQGGPGRRRAMHPCAMTVRTHFRGLNPEFT